VTELTVVMPDRPGLVAEIADTLAADRVNIETFNAHGVAGTAIIRLSVDNADRDLQALGRSGIQPVTDEALVVRLDDRPGSLAMVAKRFRNAGINIRSLRTIQTSGGTTMAAIATERTAEVLALVRDILIA
jgi:hypothetical protein